MAESGIRGKKTGQEYLSRNPICRGDREEKGLTRNVGAGVLGTREDGNPRFGGFSELGEKELEILKGKVRLEENYVLNLGLPWQQKFVHGVSFEN